MDFLSRLQIHLTKVGFKVKVDNVERRYKLGVVLYKACDF